MKRFHLEEFNNFNIFLEFWNIDLNVVYFEGSRVLNDFCVLCKAGVLVLNANTVRVFTFRFCFWRLVTGAAS